MNNEVLQKLLNAYHLLDKKDPDGSFSSVYDHKWDIFSTVSVLPRYKLIILPIQIILAAYFIQQVLHRLNMKYL